LVTLHNQVVNSAFTLYGFAVGDKLTLTTNKTNYDMATVVLYVPAVVNQGIVNNIILTKSVFLPTIVVSLVNIANSSPIVNVTFCMTGPDNVTSSYTTNASG
jgi:hypothetical protein